VRYSVFNTNAFCTAKSFLNVCRKANTSYGEAVLHARSALHCGKAATSLENGNAVFNDIHLRWMKKGG
jgi:hypothetical protein